ncbi:MAG: Ger(x)C family spore germination C-terminal domain-containing protein [Bacillota bacterium]|nr:Ger(x)C family spore germination C-terminal domain-containing protein [Bacillota bacterium]MDW7685352.1 Ger(x)C family spore germination C-terminal domain-containing protein [Bacillota bacterium]
MHKVFSILLIAVVLLTVPGCWDVEDMRNRTFITAIGIDAAQGPAAPKYKVTFEALRPSGVRPDSQTAGNLIQTLEADSISMAIEQLQARFARPTTLSHLTVIVIGEEKAKEDFQDIADYFSRHPEVQKRIRLMFVQQGEAMDLLKTQPLFERYLAAELVTMAHLEPQQSIIKTNPFIEFLLDLRTNEGKALASRILVAEGDIPIRHGAAVFKQWKLAGWLSSSETQAANWIVGDIEGTVESESNDGLFTYFVKKKSVRILPDTGSGDIRFTIKPEFPRFYTYAGGSTPSSR